jgi:EmrB/QacA subfamily drug resistance transporter
MRIASALTAARLATALRPSGGVAFRLVLRITDANRRWWVLVTMTGSLSMILIDQTVVSVALPTIQRDLDMSQTGLQWIVNAYLLSLAAFVAVGGRLGEIHGLRRVFKLGALIFVVASATCGLAQSETMLLASRAVQGFGAALMLPPSGAIVINSFGPNERGRAMGIYSGISMIFLALGPLVGGLLTQGISWRAVFYVNLPVGVGMLLLSQIVPRDQPQGARMDWLGVGTLVPGLAALVLALMQAQTWGWGSIQIVALLAAAAILIPTFVALELRRHEPLVQLRLFASRNFRADTAVLATISFGLTGLTVFGALFVQNILDFDPIEAGLSLLPVTLPMLVLAPIAGRMYDRVGPRWLVAGGTLLVGLGFLWNATVLDKQSYGWLVPGYLALGIGLALAMGPASTDTMNAAAAKLRGEASGVMQTMRQVGGTVGLAVMGTVVSSVQSSQLTSSLESLGDTAAQAAQTSDLLDDPGASTSALAGVPPDVLNAANDAFVSAIGASYYVCAGVVVVAAMGAATFLRRTQASDAEGEPPPVAVA